MIELRGYHLTQESLLPTNQVIETNMEAANAAKLGWTEELVG
jgi:hypothetical protein